MRYEGDIYSPHIAGDDYILQCTIGCSHNQCTFCYMYKTKQYRIRPLDEILEDIELAKDYYGDVNKVFLADGDALSLPTSSLIVILDHLYAAFPDLAYVGAYASALNVLDKTLPELMELQNHGLMEVHMGIESGDPEVLRSIRKGVSYEQLIEAGKKVKSAGINLLVTVILGLAGRTAKAREHSQNTARICNEIQPDYIGILTIIIQPGTEIYTKTQAREFELPTDLEILEEYRTLIADLELEHTGITSIHPSNCLHLEGMLPRDKCQLLQTINEILTDKDLSRLSPRSTKRI